jgi:hypothetical protein
MLTDTRSLNMLFIHHKAAALIAFAGIAVLASAFFAARSAAAVAWCAL